MPALQSNVARRFPVGRLYSAHRTAGQQQLAHCPITA